MCGIFALFNYDQPGENYRSRALELSKRLRHRGPDWSGCRVVGNHVLAHERLAIVGVDSGAQPIVNDDESLILSVNGEIYNHQDLRRTLKDPSTPFITQSDCEIILHLYKERGPETAKLLDGMFAFALLDVTRQRIFVARDPIGITTLYMGTSSAHPGAIWFASELKALHEECDHIRSFPPGHYFDSELPEGSRLVRYYNPQWLSPDAPIPTKPADDALLRTSLEAAVRKRLMAEVPYGVLLSGGLDSSLIASIAIREAEKLRSQALEEGDDVDSHSVLGWPRLHSFAIGLAGSPDLDAAAKVAQFIGTAHHSMTFTLQEGHDAISDVINHLETYDVTTVRASTPMYLLSRKIKALGVKMVLSGEGSDEVFGGYLYFHSAPSPAALHEETITRVRNLHTADCLRANKSTMAWGLEARVPFLDRNFLDVAMSIDPKEKESGEGRMEKFILRRAFDNPEDPYLPKEILWRQKEQFSDGVGYGWIDSLRDRAESLISDDLFSKRHQRWSKDTPSTKEAYWYRDLFEKHFPTEAATHSVDLWVPRADWGCPADPSGRAQKVHASAYKE
ncbi:MAG: asparagine synthase [Piptocephalis tieghemiana]|nr:MAG: asparagine synthase [Piptocephalis tieghemiana]